MPNFTATIKATGWSSVDSGVSASGIAQVDSRSGRSENKGSGSGGATVSFDGSRASSIYQDGLLETRPVNYAAYTFIAY